MSVTTEGVHHDHGTRHGWRQRAACRDIDTDFFFPNGETGEALAQAEAAKAVCAGCQVRPECLDFAMVTNQPYGIFGGLTEADRKTLRRRRSRERTKAS
jgi:WhiB family redox-sensing transcriptional regulator